MDQFYERGDVVVVPCLLKAGELLKLDSCRLATLPSSEGIRGLGSVLHIGESINIFADLEFEYFCVHQVL